MNETCDFFQNINQKYINVFRNNSSQGHNFKCSASSFCNAVAELQVTCSRGVSKQGIDIELCVDMVPRGLEPRTLRLLAVRSNQLSYETSCDCQGRQQSEAHALTNEVMRPLEIAKKGNNLRPPLLLAKPPATAPTPLTSIWTYARGVPVQVLGWAGANTPPFDHDPPHGPGSPIPVLLSQEQTEYGAFVLAH